MMRHGDVCIAGIGEILVDRFEDGEEHVGGAPFNVACYAHRLLRHFEQGRGLIISRVGRDDVGRRIREHVLSTGMSDACLETDEDAPSGVALVCSAGGQAGFQIAQEAAWDFPRLVDINPFDCSAVAYGTLAQRSAASRAAIQTYVRNVAGPKLYDVNLRKNMIDEKEWYEPNVIRESLQLANIAKMNDSELREVTRLLGIDQQWDETAEGSLWSAMQKMAQQFELPLIAVTRASQGALVLHEGRRYRLPDSRLKNETIFPVGGGDAFCAGLLVGENLCWPLECSLELSDALASWAVRRPEAHPPFDAEISGKIDRIAARAAKTAAVPGREVRSHEQES